MAEKSDSERLAAIETKLDFLIERRTDHETRIRVLEIRDAYILGACGFLSFTAPLILKLVFKI